MSSAASKDMAKFLAFAGKVAVNVIATLVQPYLRFLNRTLQEFGAPTIKFRSSSRGVSISVDDGSERLDERIAKIDTARQSLSDALSAMDELKERAEENKHELDFLTQQVERAELGKAKLSGELKTLRDMAALDTEAIRKVLRVPTRVSIWTERVISFLLGVMASVIASLVYEFVIKKMI